MDITTFKGSISASIQGLQYSSESDFPLQLLDWGKKSPAAIQKKITQKCKTGNASSCTGTEFFDRYIQRLERSSDPVLLADSARYKKLHALLLTNSSSITVWRCGTVSIDIYMVITTVTGHILAIKTTAIET